MTGHSAAVPSHSPALLTSQVQFVRYKQVRGRFCPDVEKVHIAIGAAMKPALQERSSKLSEPNLQITDIERRVHVSEEHVPDDPEGCPPKQKRGSEHDVTKRSAAKALAKQSCE